MYIPPPPSATQTDVNHATAIQQNALFFRLALYSLIALCLLCVTWEWFLAPLRPGGSWMIIKVLPLLPAVKGLLSKQANRQIYTLQWLSMLVLLYFTEGVMRAFSDKGLSAGLASLEIILSVLCFIACISFLRPYKRAAKLAAKLAAQQAKANES